MFWRTTGDDRFDGVFLGNVMRILMTANEPKCSPN